MMKNKYKINTLLAGAIALSAASYAVTPAHAMGPKDGEEKCYGVVKAGMNGCGAADKAHGCAGSATEDASGVEWISLPKGVCERLAGGSLEPMMDKSMDDMGGHGDMMKQ